MERAALHRALPGPGHGPSRVRVDFPVGRGRGCARSLAAPPRRNGSGTPTNARFCPWWPGSRNGLRRGREGSPRALSSKSSGSTSSTTTRGERLGIGEERVSPLESLHESLYFTTLDFFARWQAERKITGASLGRVLPVMHPAPREKGAPDALHADPGTAGGEGRPAGGAATPSPWKGSPSTRPGRVFSSPRGKSGSRSGEAVS